MLCNRRLIMLTFIVSLLQFDADLKEPKLSRKYKYEKYGMPFDFDNSSIEIIENKRSFLCVMKLNNQ